MSATDQDIELIESYLDNELSPVQVDDLQRRLSSEPALATLLSELREQRDARSILWTSYEPGDKSVDLVLKSIRREINRSLLLEKVGRTTRWAGSLAACVALGFVGGYLLRAAPASTPPGSAPQNPPSVSAAGNPGDGTIVWNPGAAKDLSNPTRDANGYLVSFTDNQGNLIGSQRFKSLQEAREFMSDFQMRQQQHKQLQNSGVKLVAEEQF